MFWFVRSSFLEKESFASLLKAASIKVLDFILNVFRKIAPLLLTPLYSGSSPACSSSVKKDSPLTEKFLLSFLRGFFNCSY